MVGALGSGLMDTHDFGLTIFAKSKVVSIGPSYGWFGYSRRLCSFKQFNLNYLRVPFFGCCRDAEVRGYVYWKLDIWSGEHEHLVNGLPHGCPAEVGEPTRFIRLAIDSWPFHVYCSFISCERSRERPSCFRVGSPRRDESRLFLFGF